MRPPATFRGNVACVHNSVKTLAGAFLKARHFHLKDLNRDANWQTVKDLWWDMVAPKREYMHWYNEGTGLAGKEPACSAKPSLDKRSLKTKKKICFLNSEFNETSSAIRAGSLSSKKYLILNVLNNTLQEKKHINH